MSASVVWLDREIAKLFHFGDEGIGREALRATHHPDHHTHRKEGDEKESASFYRQVTDRLGSANRILILGPGIAKFHLRRYMTEHHPKLAARIVACESSDHPTDAQIASLAAHFFRLGT